MRFFLLILLFFSFSCASHSSKNKPDQAASHDSLAKPAAGNIIHHFVKLPAGQIIYHIRCTQDSNQRFCLYLPAGYDTLKSYPVVYFFDAHARGMLPLKKYSKLADKYNIIMIGSDNSQNGLQMQAYDTIVDVLLAATQPVLNIDPHKIIFAGFSGGGKVAASAALANSHISAVIAAGAGIPMNNLGSSYFNYVGIVGKGDFNYWDMVDINAQLDKTPLKHELLTFDGIHEWPDAGTMSKALDFALNGNKNADTHIDYSIRDKEMAIKDNYVKMFQSSGPAYWAGEINRLSSAFKNGKGDDKWMSRRLLSLINMMTYLRTNQLLQQRHTDDVEAWLKVFKASDPANPDGPYLTADYYAIKGDKTMAIAALKSAMKLGYDDFAHISTDPLINSLRSDPDFIRIYHQLN